MSAATPTDPARTSVVKVPGRKLRSTLREVTEYLATALAGIPYPTPDWSETKWRIAQAVAIIHGISPLLSQRPGWSGEPPGWRAFLSDQRAQTIIRHRRIEATLAAVNCRAERAGIPFVPLKGTALHALGLYRAGDRPMADIDLLLARQHRGPMSRELAALGYRLVSSKDDVEELVPSDRPSRVHLGEHAANGVTVELHSAIRQPMPVLRADITAMLWPTTPHPGPNDYPSRAALMAHLLHHAAVNMQLHSLRMIQLHDMALLAPLMSADDWQHLLTLGEDHGGWWAVPPLILLQRYYPDSAPGDVMATLSARCSRVLRFIAARQRLSDVSVSNPQRLMVPALLWSQSWPEAAAAVFGRIRQAARALGGRATLPRTSELQPWITHSHRRRALEVLLGRPRPDTVMMISAALAGDFAPTDNQRHPSAA